MRVVTIPRLASLVRQARGVFAVALVSCASPGLPPGGPEDPHPPRIVSVTPDTMATRVAPRAVVFRFDEVVGERPQGATSLGALFLISPREGPPVVDWNRTAITVRPRRGWRPNTTYSVTMLPGLADLRGNVRTEGATAIFSTGPSIPQTSITGNVFDWVTGRPAARALVEAISRPDSVVYIAQADSSGRFHVRYAPPGTYTVRGFLDANNNRGFDERELWDSVRVVLADTTTVELLAFAHDTIGPRISGIEMVDSVTLRVTFDRPIDPGQRLTASLFTLRDAADSSIVPIAAARSRTEWEATRAARADSIVADSVRRTAPVRTDTVRRGTPLPARAQLPVARDTIDSIARPRRPSRPPPVSEVIIEVARPLRPREAFRLEATAIRGLLQTPRTSERALTIPAPPPPPADSAATTPRARTASPAPAGR